MAPDDRDNKVDRDGIMVTDHEQDIDPRQVPWWCSFRLALAFVGFLGFVNLYALRVNLSVAMVCMVNQTAVRSMVEPSVDVDTNYPPLNESSQCPSQTVKRVAQSDGPFVWSKELQGVILGSFFWGYLLTQVPGGWLAGRFGGKRVLGYSMLATAIATLLTPIGSYGSPYILMMLRFITGLGEGVVFPAMHAIWSKWAPPLERSKLIGFTYAGAQIGNVITLPLSGYLCDKGFAGGWPSIFYVLGIFGVVWFVLWMLVVYDSPAQHPRISDIERRHIERCIGSTKTKPITNTPWKAIFTSMPICAIIVGHTCANWGTYTLLTNIPAYMREVLKFDIKSNGLFSAIPYIIFWGMISGGGIVADFLLAKGVRTKVVRKLMYSLGTLLPGVFLIGTGYVTCQNPYIGVAILALAVGFSGLQYPGVMVNHVDNAPPFAGVLFGISNTAATLPGILAPYTIGRVTTAQTQQQWQIVFYISAVIYTVGAIFFDIFAQAEIQPWAKPYMSDQDEESRDRDVEDKPQRTSEVHPKQAEVNETTRL